MNGGSNRQTYRRNINGQIYRKKQVKKQIERERGRETGSKKKREKSRVKYQGQETVTERLREINDKESSLLFAYYNDNCSHDNCS